MAATAVQGELRRSWQCTSDYMQTCYSVAGDELPAAMPEMPSRNGLSCGPTNPPLFTEFFTHSESCTPLPCCWVHCCPGLIPARKAPQGLAHTLPVKHFSSHRRASECWQGLLVMHFKVSFVSISAYYLDHCRKLLWQVLWFMQLPAAGTLFLVAFQSTTA